MTDIPYTTAASDFMKFVAYKEDEKSDLIDFAATDFDTLKAALIDYVKAVYPLDYNNFSESDLGVMLIELVAYMGAVMSMKADMLAHEGFLKTARNPNNVRKLLELIGVRMRGPSSAAASVTLTADAAIGSGSSITIGPAERVISTTSPVDGEVVTYTLYTVKNGAIEAPSNSASIELLHEDSDNGTGTPDGKNWSNLSLVECQFAVDTGTFTDVDVLKNVKLTQKPVVDGSIQVFVSGNANVSGPYTGVESLLTASSSEQKLFSFAYDDDFAATVFFGDGVAGVLPPAGANYTIMYRVGGGERGNAKSAYINEVINGTGGEKMTVVNATPFTGGADAETVRHAKRYGKLVFRQQNRLVSNDDYTSYVNTYTSPLGVSGKGTAVTRKAFSSGNIIDVYMLERASNTQLQKASISFKKSLLESMEPIKMMTDEVVAVDGLIRTMDIVLQVSLDGKYEINEASVSNKIKSAVLDYFNLDNREFGETFYPDDLGRHVFDRVPEIRLATIDNYKDAVRLDFNEILQLNNLTINFQYV